MPVIEWTKLVEGYSRELEDRAEVIELNGALVVVVADGAGGTGGGARAAETVLQMVQERIRTAPIAKDTVGWCALLAEIDRILRDDPQAGETTAVVATVSPTGIIGASVGDSGAWLISPDRWNDLTSGQHRKPLLGSGVAIPAPFASEWRSGRLLVASDGLFKYSSRARICQVALEKDIKSAAQQLIDLVRLRSGQLPDDIAMVLCRAQSEIV